jgi:hypothetical protein
MSNEQEQPWGAQPAEQGQAWGEQPAAPEQARSTEPPAPAEQTWGSQPAPAAPPQRPRWSGRKTAAAIGIAVVIAGGGGAAIWAATSNDSSATPGQGGPGGFGGPGGGRFNAMGSLDSALHGEFVIADGTTELLQTGKVTDVSATSIGLASTDGYTKSYTIDSATLMDTGVKTGDQVTVIAKKSDNTAVSVVDRANLPQGGAGVGRRGQAPAPATP